MMYTRTMKRRQRLTRHQKETLIIGCFQIAFFLIIAAVLFWLILTPDAFCNTFMFMDYNGEGSHDDHPFCWTPFKGIERF